MMAKQNPRTVLFLCTGNYYRSRFAEVLFEHTAAKFGLSWTASSRALALERGVNNVGPMAPNAVKALEKMGIRAAEAFARFPQPVTRDELDHANFVVALKRTEHLPLLRERFPACVERVEFWEIDDDPAVLGLLEREVMDLVSRLIGGGKRSPAPVQPPEALEVAERKTANPNGSLVRVGRETKGRRGKGVTTISDIPLDDDGIQELASALKQRCGTGGTVKDGRIEIQGDQRDRIVLALEEIGYRVKRVGG